MNLGEQSFISNNARRTVNLNNSELILSVINEKGTPDHKSGK